MLLMGILLVTGSTISIFATYLFPLDKVVGTDASVAGVAFGVGIAVASFNAEGNLSWVRAAILYSVLLVVYQVVFGLFLGTAWNWTALVIGIVFAIALIALYPNRGALMPRAGTAAAGSR
jgi:hypothetical protein